MVTLFSGGKNRIISFLGRCTMLSRGLFPAALTPLHSVLKLQSTPKIFSGTGESVSFSKTQPNSTLTREVILTAKIPVEILHMIPYLIFCLLIIIGNFTVIVTNKSGWKNSFYHKFVSILSSSPLSNLKILKWKLTHFNSNHFSKWISKFLLCIKEPRQKAISVSLRTNTKRFEQQRKAVGKD